MRSFEGQEYEAEKFNKAARTNRQREMKVVVARTLSVSAVQIITAAALSLTLYIASWEIADSLLTPGGFVAMVAAMLALLKPMKDMAFVQNKLYGGSRARKVSLNCWMKKLKKIPVQKFYHVPGEKYNSRK